MPSSVALISKPIFPASAPTSCYRIYRTRLSTHCYSGDMNAGCMDLTTRQPRRAGKVPEDLFSTARSPANRACVWAHLGHFVALSITLHSHPVSLRLEGRAMHAGLEARRSA